VTNGGVASTLRDAHVRDFATVLLEDGCSAFSEETHRTNVAALRSVADVMSCADFITALQARR
jgi:ureidoacrylate peracid hydrolase